MCPRQALPVGRWRSVPRIVIVAGAVVLTACSGRSSSSHAAAPANRPFSFAMFGDTPYSAAEARAKPFSFEDQLVAQG